MKNPGKENLDEYIEWLRSELEEARAKKDEELKQIAIKKTEEDNLIRQNFDSYTVKDIDKFRCSEKLKQKLLQKHLDAMTRREEQYESRWAGQKNYMFLKTIQDIKDLMNASDTALYEIPVSKKLFDSKYALISDSEIADIKKEKADRPLVEIFATCF